MRKLLLCLGAATCLAGCQTAMSSAPVRTVSLEDGSPEHPLKIGHLRIEHLPTTADLRNGYPREALRNDTPGKVKLVCLAQSDGKLSNCIVKEAIPSAAGFDDATLLVVKYVKLSPGLYTGKFVDFTLTWRTAS